MRTRIDVLAFIDELSHDNNFEEFFDEESELSALEMPAVAERSSQSQLVGGIQGRAHA